MEASRPGGRPLKPPPPSYTAGAAYLKHPLRAQVYSRCGMLKIPTTCTEIYSRCGTLKTPTTCTGTGRDQLPGGPHLPTGRASQHWPGGASERHQFLVGLDPRCLLTSNQGPEITAPGRGHRRTRLRARACPLPLGETWPGLGLTKSLCREEAVGVPKGSHAPQGLSG